MVLEQKLGRKCEVAKFLNLAFSELKKKKFGLSSTDRTRHFSALLFIYSTASYYKIDIFKNCSII